MPFVAIHRDRSRSTAGARLRRGAARVSTAAALVIGLVTPVRAQSGYVTLDLGTLGGTSVDMSLAEGINNRGEIVGQSSVNGQTHAFLWTASGGLRDLGTLGGASSVATAINDSGQVVGWAMNGAGVRRAFLWTDTGGMIDIGTLGGPSSEAVAINNAGLVAGFSLTTSGQNHAFRWSPSGGMVGMGTLGGPSSAATGINDAGTISCNGQTPNFDTYPCVGTTNLIQLLGTVPNAFSGRAFAINVQGQVVGVDPSGAIIWPNPVATWVATRITAPGTPSDINDSGQIVGSTGSGHGFVWSQSAGSTDLGPNSGASEINNGGIVVGYTTVGGQRHATRWEPGGGPVTGVTLTTDLASPQPAGTRIVLTGAVIGGTSPISYRFWLQPWATGDWQVLQDWNTTSTISWTPAAEGGYNLSVEARGAVATEAEAQAATGYTIGSGGGGGGGGGGTTMTGITLSTNPNDPQPLGTTIVLSGAGAGGTPPYSYRFWVQPWNGAWQILRDWSPTPTASWTPTVVGGYNVSVEGRSSGGSSADVGAANTYVINAPTGGGGGGGAMTGVTLAASTFWPQPLGTSVTWTATGQGGTTPYAFRFWVQPWNGAWQVMRDWSTTPSFVWTPTAVGGYNVSVEARSAGATAVQMQSAEIFMIAAP